MDGIEATEIISTGVTRHPRRHPDDVRARRVRVRRAPGRRLRVPAQADPAGGPDRRGPRGRGRVSRCCRRRSPAGSSRRSCRRPRCREPSPELDSLTGREREVLVALASGASNAELASRLFVSEETIRTHVKRVLHKLALRDRAQAIVFAYESGVVTAGVGLTGLEVARSHCAGARTRPRARRRIRTWQAGSARRTSPSSGSAPASRTSSVPRSSSAAPAAARSRGSARSTTRSPRRST